MTATMRGDLRERFADRGQAGRLLADLVAPKIEGEDVVVLALPRGGVPVGYEVASRVGAPLDVLLVRKLGVPWQPELAFGAIASVTARMRRSLRGRRASTRISRLPTWIEPRGSSKKARYHPVGWSLHERAKTRPSTTTGHTAV